jgi:hypothetical protein
MAAVAVIGFVAYLIAANFGLVPSPLAPLFRAAAPAISVIQAPPAPSSGSDVKVPPPPAVVEPPAAPKPAASPDVTDTTKPAVAISTEDGMKMELVSAAHVEGTASDLGSGVEKVVVIFETASEKRVVPADLNCAGGKCTWKAKVPSALADYVVTAKAWDRAANEGTSKPISLMVVNTGDTVEQVGDTVSRVPGALVGVVTGLVDGLGLGD